MCEPLFFIFGFCDSLHYLCFAPDSCVKFIFFVIQPFLNSNLKRS